MTSMRSSSGPGIVSAWLAVAMNTTSDRSSSTSREWSRNVEVCGGASTSSAEPRGFEHLEEGRARVPARVGSDLVDLVEEDDRVHRPGVAQGADEAARERAD